MRNIADLLIDKIIEKKCPVVVGLDPVISRIPSLYKKDKSNDIKGVTEAIKEFNIDIIDCIKNKVPAVKPQIAFYEQYGSLGVKAFEETVSYAKACNLIVIEDGKRNDIGNTAKAYACGHLGQVDLINGKMVSPINTDFLTVSPFLGSESLVPFIDVCMQENKGIFILVKTSNPSSGEIQDIVSSSGRSVSYSLGEFVSKAANQFLGEHGYSSIGAVVGATYPEEVIELRKVMPNSIFLVPGYGTQGGSGKDIVPSFNSDGLGAIVNASRSIIFAYEKTYSINCTRAEYLSSVYEAVDVMQKDVYEALKSSCVDMKY